jgi:hypothetical protein
MVKTISLRFFAIILSCFFLCNTNTLSQNNQFFLNQFNQYQDFQNWYNFWVDSFPNVELNKLKFEHKNSHILTGSQSPPDKVHETTNRIFTLNYNKTGNIAIDLYYDVTFLNVLENGSLIVKGRDADPALIIYDRINAHAYYHTSGPTAFYDESVWTSDTSFAIFGVSFWPGQDSFQRFMVLRGFIKKETMMIDVYLSEELPWRSSWTEYMSYKYPDILFDFL